MRKKWDRMSIFLKPRLKDIEPYVPGEQPKDKGYIKLNTNESPYPPGEKVIRAITEGELKNLRLYPSPTQDTLKEALAKRYSEYFSAAKENVFVSNGSDDILNFAFMAYCDEERRAVYPDITYGFYNVFSEFQNVGKVEIPLKEDFSIEVSDYLNLKNKLGQAPGLIVFANPNAPTGIGLALSQVEEIAKTNPESVVLVDEAYVDFGGNTALPLIEKYENVLVSRTFSKSASLAGGRLGFAFSSPAIIEDLEMVKYSTNPYSINRMTELAGLAVLEESDYYINNCKRIMETREKTRKALLEMGFRVPRSSANFLFVGCGETSKDEGVKKPTARDIYLKLKEEGILVRWFNKDRISEFIRVTIGTEEEMEMFLKKMEGIV